MLKWISGLTLASIPFVWVTSSSVSAQNGQAPFVTIVSMLTDIQDTLDTLGEALGGLDPSAPADVVTGPLQRASNPASNFKCMVVNTGSEAASVSIELRDVAGTLDDSTDCESVAPGATCALESDTAFQVSYCRVTGLSPATARVTLCAREAAVCTSTVTAP